MLGTTEEKKAAAASVYQTAIGLLAIFHMIEWLRQLAFMAGALTGTNLMHIYYGLSLNVPFGFIAIFVGIAARYGEEGTKCAQYQTFRADYLTYNLITLFVYLFSCFHHVLLLKFLGVDWCYEVFIEEEEDDDD